MRNAGLDGAQAGIKTAGRNTNNLRYADDTNHMVENEEEQKSLLMESEKAGLKFSGRRFLGTNGATLWLWSCLPKPGAPGP